MISRCMKLIVYVTLSTTLVTCQFAKEGYVGVNFNAGAGTGVEVSGSGAGNIAKTYEKTYESDQSAGANIGGSIVKTVEVPAAPVHSSLYIEKHIQPVQVHKEIQYHPAPVIADTVVTKEIVAPAPQNVYVTKHVYGRRHVHPRRKYVYVNADAEVAPPQAGFLTKLFAVGAAPAPAVVHAETEVQKQVVIPQNTVQHQNSYTATATVNKNGQLFNDIFNIPISTLRAVNNLVNNIVGGVSVTKQVNTHAVVAPDAYVNSNANANAYVHAEGHVQG